MRSVFPSDFCLEPPPRSISYNPLYRPDVSPLVSSPSSTSTNSTFSLFSSSSSTLPTYQVSRSQHRGIYLQDSNTFKFQSTDMQAQSYTPTLQVPASQQCKLLQDPSQSLNNSSVSCHLKLSMMPLVPQRSYRKLKNICLFCKSNKESYKCYSTHTLKDENGNITCPILFRYVCPTCQATGKDAHTKAYCPTNPHKPFKPFRPWSRCNPTRTPVYIIP